MPTASAQQNEDFHGAEQSEHDHSRDHGEATNWIKSLLAKFHPILVHFPIAGVFFAFFLQMGGFLFKKKDVRFSVRLTLILSTIFAWIAALSGWLNASSRSFGVEELHLLSTHRWLAVGTCVSLLVCTLLHCRTFRSEGRLYAAFMLMLVLSISLVSLTGHFGGMLVFGAEYFKF